MQRQLFSPLYGRVQPTQPVVRGGTDAKSAPNAVMNLGLVASDMLGQPGGPSSLDMDGYIPAEQLPEEFSNAPTIIGPASVPLGKVSEYVISNFHLDLTYNIVPGPGLSLVSQAGAVFKLRSSIEGAAFFNVNDAMYDIVVTAALPEKPVVISPLDKATRLAVDLTITSSQFTTTYGNGLDSHQSTQWQISEKEDFSTVVVDETSNTNLTTFKPAGLSDIKTYYLRLRHKGVLLGWSEWSNPIMFQTKSRYPEDLKTTLINTVTPTDAETLGYSLSISSDGATCIAASSILYARAFIFQKTGDNWTQQATLVPPPSFASVAAGFGCSVSISGDGNTAVIGAYSTEYSDSNDYHPAGKVLHGMAFVYTRTDSSWSPGEPLQSVGLINAGNYIHYGFAVAVSGDGNTIAVGAPHDDKTNYNEDQGSVSVFVKTSGAWTFQARLLPSDTTWAEHGGRSVSLSRDGNVLVYGCTYAAASGAQPIGIARIHTRSGGTWTSQGHVVPTAPLVGGQDFGRSIALSADGNHFVVGSPLHSEPGVGGNHGKVYMYSNVAGSWTFVQSFSGTSVAGNDFFGQAVAINGDGTMVAIGAPAEDKNGIVDSGCVYLYIKSGGNWTLAVDKLQMPLTYLKKDKFGSSLGLTPDGKFLAVGAPTATFLQKMQGAVYILG